MPLLTLLLSRTQLLWWTNPTSVPASLLREAFPDCHLTSLSSTVSVPLHLVWARTLTPLHILHWSVSTTVCGSLEAGNVPNSSLFITQFPAQGLTVGKHSGDLDGGELHWERENLKRWGPSLSCSFLPIRLQLPYQYTGVRNRCPVLHGALLWVTNLCLHSGGREYVWNLQCPPGSTCDQEPMISHGTIIFPAFQLPKKKKKLHMCWRYKQGLERSHLCLGWADQ